MKNIFKSLSKFIIMFSFFILVPTLLLAQTGPGVTFTNSEQSSCPSVTDVKSLICNMQSLVNSVVPLLIALGVFYFVWGVINFMIADSEEAKTKGKDKIIYGIIGLAVIVGLWGLVNVVVNTFDLSGSQAPSGININGTSSTCSLEGIDKPAFQNYLGYATCIINSSVIPFLFAIAVVVFVWGTVKFLFINSDEEAKREQGKQFMIWGIIALAVMLSVWGLVGILRTTFDPNGDNSLLPQVEPPK